MCSLGGSQVAQWVKNSPAMQESRKEGLIPGLESSPGGGHGNPPPTHTLFLPRESRGKRSLAGYSPQGRREWDTTEETEDVPTLVLYHTEL